MRWHARLALLFLFLDVLFGTAPNLKGQETPGTDQAYQRVFVPQSDLSQLVPNGFIPIKISELEQLLGRDNHSRLDSLQLQVPSVGQIRLVANLVGEDLLSDASCFAIRYLDDVRGQINLRPLSMAIKPCLLNATQDRNASLFSSLVYSNDGTAKLSVDESVDLWFGWSLHAYRSKPGKWLDFRLELPPCVDARMLIRLPPAWRMDAESNVTYRIDHPSDFLRSDWPPPTGDGWKNHENWWLLELGGSSHTEFRISRTEETQPQRFPLVVRNQRIDHEVSLEGTNLQAQWTTDLLPETAAAWSIELADPLRVQKITCNGMAIDWEQRGGLVVARQPSLEYQASQTDRITPSPEGLIGLGGSQQWELIASSLQSTYTVASQPTTEDPWTPLRISNAFVLSGESFFRVTEPIQVHTLEVDGGHTLRSVSDLISPAPDRAAFSSRIWKTEWTEAPPPWRISTSMTPSQIPAELLVQLIPQTESILANVTVRCDLANNARSSLPFRIAEGWILEGVNSLESDLSLQVASTSAELAFPLEIQSNPVINNRSIFFELQLRRFNASVNRESLQVPTGPILEFQDIVPNTTYLVENGSGFSLKPSVEALRHRVRERQMIEWQKRRLPRFAEPWLFHPEAGPMTELLFERQSVNFLIDNETHVLQMGDSIEIQYVLRCTPVSGSVQRLAVLASDRLHHPIAWSLHQSATSQRVTPLLEIGNESVSDAGNGVDAPMEIRLKSATLEPFELHGFLRLPAQGTSRIPLLATMEAFQERANLWIDPSLNPELKGKRVSQLTPQRRDPQSAIADLGFAFEASPNNTLAIAPTPPSTDRPSNAPRIALESIMDVGMPTGTWLHFIVWEVEDWSSPLLCQLPVHWNLERLYLDGAPHWGGERNDEDGTLSILPPFNTQMSHQIVLECSDRNLAIPYPAEFPFEWPAVDAVLMNSSRLAIVPPSWSFQYQGAKKHLASSIPWRSQLFPLKPPSNGLPTDFANDRMPSIPYFKNANAISFLNHSIYELPKRQRATFSAFRQTRNWITPAATIDLPVVDKQAEFAWTWITLLVALGLGAWLSRGRWVNLLIWLGVGIGASAPLLLYANSLANSFGIAWCVGLILGYTLSWSWRSLSWRTTKTGKLASNSRLGIAARVLVLLLALGGSVTDCVVRSVAAQPPQAILIPIDRKGQVDGTTAYISPDLYQRLLSPSSSKSSQYFEVVSATHQVTLLAGLQRSTLETLVTYEFLITNSDNWIRLPFSSTIEPTSSPLRLKRFLVNDLEVLQGTRLRIERGELLWKPERMGRTRVRIVTELQTAPTEEGTSIASLPIIPVPTATLEVATNAEAQDLRIQANGQVLNPAAGKYLAQLGPLPQIHLQWKSAQPRPIRTEVRAESITLLDLGHEQPQAWTRLVVGQSLSNAESVEIEAPSDWQPLGVNWRDAVLQNVTNSSTLAKRRYRLSWNRRPSPAADERNPHRLEIYWVPESRNGSLLSVPMVELVGTRPAKQQVAVIQSNMNLWKLDGVTAWPAVPDPIDTIDATPFGALPFQQAFDVPESTPPALLRRAKRQENVNARGECHVHFERERLVITLELLVGNGTDVAPSERFSPLRVGIPHHAIPKSVWINGQMVDFVASNDPASAITIYPDASQPTWQEVRVQCEVPTSIDNTTPWPVFQLPMDVVDLRMRCTRAPNVSIAIHGTDAWSPSPIAFDSSSKESQTTSVEMGQWTIPRRWFQEQSIASTATWRIEQEQTWNGQVLTEFNRIDNRWHLRIRGKLQASQSIPTCLLLETSRTFAEALSGACLLKKETLPVSNRGLLHLLPQVSSDGSWRLELEGILPGNSNEPFDFPDTRWLGADSLEQLVCLPLTYQAQPLQWEVTGAEVVPATVLSSSLSDDDLLTSHQFYRKNVARLQVQLNSTPQSEAAARSLFSSHDCRLMTAKTLQIDSHFWLLPNNQSHLELHLPDSQRLMRISVHGRPWNFDPASHRLSIPLFPNHGPVLIHTTIFDSVLESSQVAEIALPSFLDLDPVEPMVIWDRETGDALGWEAMMNESSSGWSTAYRDQLLAQLNEACEQIRRGLTDHPEKLVARKADWYQPWQKELWSLLQQAKSIDDPSVPKSPSVLGWKQVQENLERLEREPIGLDRLTQGQTPTHSYETGLASHFNVSIRGSIWCKSDSKFLTLRVYRPPPQATDTVGFRLAIGIGLLLLAVILIKGPSLPWPKLDWDKAPWSGFAIASGVSLLAFPWPWIGGTLAVLAVATAIRQSFQQRRRSGTWDQPISSPPIDRAN